MTQWDGLGRKVGGGFGMGVICTPVADSCQCMAKKKHHNIINPVASNKNKLINLK